MEEEAGEADRRGGRGGAAVLVVSGVFWHVLGAAVGAFFRHFGGGGRGTGPGGSG